MSKKSTAIYRVEYKKYLRPFTNVRRAVGYFATELSHKDVLVNKIGYRKNGNNLVDLKDEASYQLDINFTAIRLKYGYTFFGERGFPVFNAFIGTGVGYTNNQNLNLPSGYREKLVLELASSENVKIFQIDCNQFHETHT